MFAMAAVLMLAAVSCKKDDGGLGTDVGAVNVGDGVVTVIAEPWDNADGARTAYITVSTCRESVTVAVRQTDEENFN